MNIKDNVLMYCTIRSTQGFCDTYFDARRNVLRIQMSVYEWMKKQKSLHYLAFLFKHNIIMEIFKVGIKDNDFLSSEEFKIWYKLNHNFFF